MTETLNEADPEAKKRGCKDLGADSQAAIKADAKARRKWLKGRAGRCPYCHAEFLLAAPLPYGPGQWDREKELEWADAALKWVRDRFPHSVVVVAASLHRDETSPTSTS